MDIFEVGVTFRWVFVIWPVSGFRLQSSDYSHLETFSRCLPLDHDFELVIVYLKLSFVRFTPCVHIMCVLLSWDF